MLSAGRAWLVLAHAFDRQGVVVSGRRGMCIAFLLRREEAMTRNLGWSWSLKVAVMIAVATAIWASATTYALQSLHERLRTSPPVSAR